MGINFHDESNDGNYSMVDYSDATVIVVVLQTTAGWRRAPA